MGPSLGYAGETWTRDQHVAEAVSHRPNPLGAATAEHGGRGSGVGLRESGRPGGGTARTDQACEGYLGREEVTGVAAGEEWGPRKLVWFFVGFT